MTGFRALALRHDPTPQRHEMLWLPPHLQAPRLDLGDIKQHRGERLEALSRVSDLLDGFFLPVRQWWAIATRGLDHEHVHVATERGKRGAQRMGRVLDE